MQHAHNPVDWYPWGDEAFEKARREDKPIFLSIGYSTCHWCHVMERESFEDPVVGQMMNEVFVSIKVDREERPDIDGIYMTACQMFTGGGGWPLNIIMTPDGKPFFAGAYFPRDSRQSRIGMLELVPRIREIWTEQRQSVADSAEKVVAALQQETGAYSGEPLDVSVPDRAYEYLLQRFDEENGGFGRPPKFPSPVNLLFLLRYWKRTGKAVALEMVERTLEAIRQGGIYDHIGFGIHRYATDAQWLVPHFEKMLYDQALMAMTYTETYQATGNDFYGRTAREICDYVLRELVGPEGGFYSGQDADSEGPDGNSEEGRFYVWTEEDIRRALGHETAELVVSVFNVSPGGNFAEEASGRRTGASILHLSETTGTIASKLGISEKELAERLEGVRRQLFAARDQRIHPHRDDKVLADWNGLMIAALAKAAQVFDEPRYAEAAQRSADFILGAMRRSDGRLLHRYRDGESAIDAYLTDYAFFVWGLIDLYEATFETRYLESALDLNSDMLAHFSDREKGGLFFTPDDGEKLLVRRKEDHDGALPSGSSAAMLNLYRLNRMTGHAGLEEQAESIGRAVARDVNHLPAAYTHLIAAVEFGMGPSHDVVIAGDPHAEDTKGLLRALRAPFVPEKTVLLRTPSTAIGRIARFTEKLTPVDGKATAYVCRNFSCAMSTTNAEKMLELLGVKR